MAEQGDKYTAQFYAGVSGNYDSAEIIAPMLLHLLQPASVVDMGCGTGAWLKAFEENGVHDILGFDGPWVDDSQLLIQANQFERTDLENPPEPRRRFDLAISLEVAEHLAAARAEGFVQTLVRLADVVLFSAAIPFQGGSHHVNEQWPAYWIDRFKIHGYVLFDIIRPRIWDNPDVRWWYAQNTLLFVHHRRVSDFPALKTWADEEDWQGRAVVHPRKLIQAADPAVVAPVNAVKLLLRSLRSRLGGP